MLLSIYIPLLLPIIAPHANWTAVTHSHHATTAILAPKIEMSSEIAQPKGSLLLRPIGVGL